MVLAAGPLSMGGCGQRPLIRSLRSTLLLVNDPRWVVHSPYTLGKGTFVEQDPTMVAAWPSVPLSGPH